MNILIAEDDPNDVVLLSRALRRIGHIESVNVVRNGKELVSYILGESPYNDRALYPLPGLILLDIKMPIMGGLEALHWIRNCSRIRRVPVVIFTSTLDQSDKIAAYAGGVNSFLVKSPLIYMTDTLAGVLKYWVTENQPPELPHD